ncbi:hypothetical protein WR25_15216 isoform C [Diploscapter pachys]|uniref:Uncharacterized protein n=1 Tax=Diploscapter pachys TaxID=2018661 RepID=A0A2A2LUP9_9BILA|nr:hypothetical protein WR25_15216 isoform A [Diploscapter pachys]PAV89901.1 hypothetical protein WR25_15216 isoform C [Diploscapter pachys]
MIYIGIDLGTTFSCVATIKPNGKPTVIPNFDGLKVTPSVVAYPNGETLEPLVGKSAVKSSVPLENIIYDSKRFIGRQYNDESVQEDMKSWPFKIIDDKGKPLVKLTHNNEEKKLAAEEISAEVLKMMKKIAENHLRKEVTRAVITVPAHFDQRQRHSTMEAAKLAGIEVIRLVNEPTAVAIAYGVHNQGKKNVFIYDLGGGTFDCSIVKCNGSNKISVVATGGHKHLGGQDFDKIIADYALENFKNFPRNNPKMMRRLIKECTEAKMTLSCHGTATIFIDSTVSDDGWKLILTRDKLNQLIDKKLRGTLDIVDEALRTANMKATDIDIVILAGGSTRILMVQDLLEKKFSKDKLWYDSNKNLLKILNLRV